MRAPVVKRSAAPADLHAAALVDILWSRRSDATLDRAIEDLRQAARLSDAPAPILVDLGAAYALRAARRQRAVDLLEALDVTLDALAREPANPVARFNIATLCARLGLDREATSAWRAYRAVDSTSPWSRDARPGVAATISSDSLRAGPEVARQRAWDVTLGMWADAILAGEFARATEEARQAAATASALDAMHGDGSLRDALDTIAVHENDRAALRRLALAHHAYAAGRALYAAPDYADAVRVLDSAARLAPAGTAVRAWAEQARSASQVNASRVLDAVPTLERLVARVDSARWPALAGHARWTLGVTRLWARRPEDAIALLDRAATLFLRAGERRHTGAVRYLAATGLDALGDSRAADDLMLAGLNAMRATPPSIWQHNLLYLWSVQVAAAGLPRAATRLQDEGVQVASELANPVSSIEARLARVRLAVTSSARDDRLVSADLTFADSAIRRLPPTTSRARMQADLALARAQLALRTRPMEAIAPLDSVVAFFDSTKNGVRLLPALVARADARLGAERVADAEADLARATNMLVEQRGAITAAAYRASFLDGMRRVVDRFVLLRLASADTVGALEILERGRAPLRLASDRAWTREARPNVGTTLDYALIGDTLLTWVVDAQHISLVRRTIDRERFVSALGRVRAGMELRASLNTMESDLGQLREWLVSPVRDGLAAGSPLAIVADGVIAGVPFAALLDQRTHRFLVEDYTLRIASTLAEATAARSAHVSGRVSDALLIGDPAFDRSSFPELGRLVAARAEIDSIATLYAARGTPTHILNDTLATRTALASIRDADVLHYAGHAIFDDDRPERSFLVLAASRDTTHDRGRLAASDIARLDLQRVRLVVLSACETARPTLTESGGFAGIADGFRAAGVGGVIGSLWRVDDALTLPLMTAFHRAYGATGDAAGALRSAQLELLHSSRGELRSPSAWAGFRYAGVQ